MIEKAHVSRSVDELLFQIEKIKWGSNEFTCLKCGNNFYGKGAKPRSRRCTSCGYDESVTAHTALDGIEYKNLDHAFDVLDNICKQTILVESPGHISTEALSSYISEFNWHDVDNVFTRATYIDSNSGKRIKANRLIERSKTKTELRGRFQHWMGLQNIQLVGKVYALLIPVKNASQLYKSDDYILALEEERTMYGGYGNEYSFSYGFIWAEIIEKDKLDDLHQIFCKHLSIHATIDIYTSYNYDFSYIQKTFLNLNIHACELADHLPINKTVNRITHWLKKITRNVNSNNATLALFEFAFLYNCLVECADLYEEVDKQIGDHVKDRLLTQMIKGSASPVFQYLHS